MSAQAEALGEVPASIGRGGESEPRVGAMVVAHAGQGSPATLADGPVRAVQAARARLDAGDSATEAAIVGVELLEDDPRFNAGVGANLRMDGQTIQADAAVMDDRNRFGAVAGIRGVRHPVRVAEAVAQSPHALIAGAGAQAFAQTLGLESGQLTTQRARDKLARGWARLMGGQAPAGWENFDWRKHWNYEVPAPKDASEAAAMAAGTTAQAEPDTQDTVGVVVRSGDGRYAAALSTGGTTMALLGRVGDVPQLGAGLYAGPQGAVAATGKGEAILRERVAAEVYRLLARGMEPNQAIRVAIRNITPAEGVGVIAVSERGWGALATSQMAWAAQEGAQLHRADEVIWK